MKRNGVHIILLVANLVLLIATIVFGLITKSSFSGKTGNTYFQSLPVIQRAAHVDQLKSNEQGSGFNSLSQIENDASDIIVGTFTGERSYGYQAFISTVCVDKAFKGDTSEGENIVIYEPLQVIPVSSINYNLNVQSEEILAELGKKDAKIIRQSPISSYFYGKNAMRDNATYLFFLKKKWVNSYKQEQQKPTYQMLNNAYSRIIITDDTSVFMLPDPEVTTLFNSEKLDQLLNDTQAVNEYSKISAEILNKYHF